MTTHIVDRNKMVLLPSKLAAENGAKALLIGEFSEEFEMQVGDCDKCACSACCCDPPTTDQVTVPVSWTTIKAIYAKIVDHFGKPATWHPINPADPATLPGEDDADENGRVHIRWPNGTVGLEFVHIILKHPLTFYRFHWSPRIKQVPPEFPVRKNW